MFSLESAIKDGRRQSTYITYIQPIMEVRRKLHVIKYADVTEIIFSSQHKNKGLNPEAIGVKYNRHGTIFSTYALKEVLISAGVFGSPMLLFKSGIGPAKMLRKANVSRDFNRG